MSIMQDWTMTLGLRHQGVLLTAVRGCDTAPKHSPSKALTRFLRSVLLNAHCGDPAKSRSFIEVPTRESFDAAQRGFFDEWDALPTHYVLHLAHTAEVIGYHHPDPGVADRWLTFYRAICRKMHVMPETMQALDARLGADEDTFARAQ